MNIPKEHQKEFAGFPDVLRQLVEAELAAGNAIAELSHGHPAAPCGAWIRLEKNVTTRPREATEELDFYERHTSSHSGEFTDAKRHFFVLEPPLPPEPEPDMDAIRAEMEARNRAANDPALLAAAERPAASIRELGASAEEGSARRRDVDSSSPRVKQFVASMAIDYEKWREGIGYDLDALKGATRKELREIEALLFAQGITGWRDVQALAALGTSRSRAALREALHSGSEEVRMAVHSYAPETLTDAERTASLVRALENAEFYGGLTQALGEVEEFHPPEVIDALLRGLSGRDGGTACHFAAMLYYLHGKSSMPFDWDHRPFFLRFNTENAAERKEAIRELCATIGVDPRKAR